MGRSRWMLILGLIAVLPPTAPAAPAAAGETLRCVAGITPVAYMVTQVAGDRAGVITLARPDQCPETFEPSAKQMVALAGAHVFFRIGFGFERRCADKLERQGGLRIVDLGAGLRINRGLTLSHACAAGEHAGHDHGVQNTAEVGEDPHVWLDPGRVAIMARRIAETLEQLDPGGAPIYQANLARFLSELEALSGRLQAILAPVKGQRFLVYHPSWTYFAETFGLELVAIEQDGKEPSAKHLQRLAALFENTRPLILFVDPADGNRRARFMAERLGAELVLIDPLAQDYAANLETVAGQVRAALLGPPAAEKAGGDAAP